MSKTIRIVVVEDNKRFAESLKEIVEIEDGMIWVACFASSEACLHAFTGEHAPEVDVVLLDLQLPGKNGLTLVPALKKVAPEANILVLTQDDDYHTTLEAIRLGVSGYILKDAGIADIRNAIREVHEGGSVIDPQLSRLVLNALTSDDSTIDNLLSRRERQVLELLAMGYVKKEVADQLDLSYRAVALYTENVYKKLQVPNIAAAVATAYRRNLI